jgi:hypothetical protein
MMVRQMRTLLNLEVKPELGKLGSHGLIFDDDDVVRLLRAAVEREGNQVAFAQRYGLERTLLNQILNGKRLATGAVLKFLGLRKVYTSE